MKRIATIVLAAVLGMCCSNAQAEENVKIGKQNIKLASRMMTPEALWAMGRIGGVEASPDGRQVVFQVGYYSVKQNKGHQVICVMNADGSNRQQIGRAHV